MLASSRTNCINSATARTNDHLVAMLIGKNKLFAENSISEFVHGMRARVSEVLINNNYRMTIATKIGRKSLALT